MSAYSFSLFESDKGYMLYLKGAKIYDPDDDDWAAGMGDWTPKDPYLLLAETELNGQSWDKVQKKVEKTLKDFIKTETFKSSYFAKAKAITTGFDDGDLVRIR